jgi:ketosteroid isomerase-like protein
MDTKQVGERLVALCNDGKNEQAVNELYHDDVISVEAMAGGPMPAESRGIEAVRGKGKWWSENHEVHSSRTEGPYPHHEKFAASHHYEVTPKTGPMAGKRFKMDEVAVYTVKDGKVVREEFYYNT